MLQNAFRNGDEAVRFAKLVKPAMQIYMDELAA